MVESMSGVPNGDGKNYVGIKDTTTNKEYKNIINAKINSILNGKKEISINELKKNSLFQNMDKKTEDRFNAIAGIDGNTETLSADELKILYALADGKLVKGSDGKEKFNFDGKMENANGSALKDAYHKEIIEVIKNLAPQSSSKFIKAFNDYTRHTTTIDKSKLGAGKTYEQQLKSSDSNEVMNAINNNTLTEFTDKQVKN